MKYICFIIALFTFSQIVVSQEYSDICPSTPSHQFIVNGEEVTDIKTGLIWKKCQFGRTGSRCQRGLNGEQGDEFLGYSTYSEAQQIAAIEAHRTGKAWRIPNIKELLSIRETCWEPAINEGIFPYTELGNVLSSTDGLVVGSFRGAIESPSSLGYLRLVRTGK